MLFSPNNFERTTTMKKFTAIVLALLMLAVEMLAVSCNNQPDPADTQDVETSGTAEATNAVTERLPLNVPENLDFGGNAIKFLVIDDIFNGAEWESRDIYEEEDSTDPIASAVYTRNQTLQNKYKTVIIQEEATNTGAVAKRAIDSGDDEFQVLMCDMKSTVGLVQSGQLRDLNSISTMDMSNPWWDQNIAKNCSIGGKLFFTTGDISIMDNDATWVMMFNKKMISDLDLESPYDLVKNNQWTFDKMYELMKAATRDEGISGAVEWDADTFGFVTHNSSLEAFFYAAGLKIIEKDNEDMPMFPESVEYKERVDSVLKSSIKLWTDKKTTWSADRDGHTAQDLQRVFEEGRGLFLGEVMQLVFRLREMQIDFGLIPYPKYDSKQENYGHFVHSTAALLSIPVSCRDYEKIGSFVEAMAYESMYTVTPAYYETALTGKYFRDPESSEMLDIILQSRTFDLGSGHLFAWGDVCSVFTNLLGKGSSDYASAYQRRIKAARTKLTKELAKILKDA